MHVPPNFAAIARLFWLMVGPMILFVSAYIIGSEGGGWLTLADVVFLATLAGVIAARWIEFLSGNAQTSTGDPATSAHLLRYGVGAAVVGLAVWVGANVVGNHLPTT
jgi:hypothetical protein